MSNLWSNLAVVAPGSCTVEYKQLDMCTQSEADKCVANFEKVT